MHTWEGRLRLRRTADGGWSPGEGDSGQCCLQEKALPHSTVAVPAVQDPVPGPRGAGNESHGPAGTLPALRLWLLGLKEEQEGECEDLVSFSNHIG